MNDETRKLLKIFGVAVTDFEAEAEKLAATASQMSGGTDKAQVWLSSRTRPTCAVNLTPAGSKRPKTFSQRRTDCLLRLADAAARLHVVDTTEIQSARMEAHE
jgi:hypothetical protein